MTEAIVASAVPMVELAPPPAKPDIMPAASPVTPTTESPYTPSVTIVFTELIDPGSTVDAKPALEYNVNLTPESTATAMVEFGASTTTVPDVQSPPNELKPEAPATNAVEPTASETTSVTEAPTEAATTNATQPVEQPASPTTTTAPPNAEVRVAAESTVLSEEQTNALLQEASSLLLELKDMRVFLTSLAQNLGDTPLAGEFRHNVLTMIKNLPAGDVPKEMAVRLKTLQDKIPAGYASKRSTELLSFLTTNQKDFPNLITDKLTVAVADGKVNDEQVVLSITNDNTTALGDRMRGAMGIEEKQLHTAMNNLAEATGKPGWKDRWEAFMMKHPKLKPHLPSWAELRAKAPGYLMMFGMALMMLNSFMDEGGGRQGH